MLVPSGVIIETLEGPEILVIYQVDGLRYHGFLNYSDDSWTLDRTLDLFSTDKIKRLFVVVGWPEQTAEFVIERHYDEFKDWLESKGES